jgi:hypothetical protein
MDCPAWMQNSGMAKNKRKRNPKSVLKLPDLEQSKISGPEQPHVAEFPSVV